MGLDVRALAESAATIAKSSQTTDTVGGDKNLPWAFDLLVRPIRGFDIAVISVARMESCAVARLPSGDAGPVDLESDGTFDDLSGSDRLAGQGAN